jgi:hypothetical protein
MPHNCKYGWASEKLEPTIIDIWVAVYVNRTRCEWDQFEYRSFNLTMNSQCTRSPSLLRMLCHCLDCGLHISYIIFPRSLNHRRNLRDMRGEVIELTQDVASTVVSLPSKNMRLVSVAHEHSRRSQTVTALTLKSTEATMWLWTRCLPNGN